MSFVKENKVFLIYLLIICVIIIFLFSHLMTNKDNKLEDNQLTVSNVDFNDIYSSDLSKESVFAKAYIQPDSNIDLTDISDLYETADLVVIGTITQKGKGQMLNELEYPGIFGSIKVDTTLKGNLEKESVDFFTNGGYCTIKEYVDVISNTNKEKIDKMGLSNLTEEELNNKYLVFNYQYGTNFTIGTRYVLMLKKINDKYISISNYGFFEIPKDKIVYSIQDLL